MCQAANNGIFSVAPLSGIVPLDVTATFQNGSSCTPFTLTWGDGTNDNYSGPPTGTSCTQQTVTITKTHTYSQAGTSTVSFQMGSAATSTQIVTVLSATGTAPTITSQDTNDTYPGGTVHIHGTNFTAANDILLDGTAVQTNVGSTDNGTTLTLLIPANYPTGDHNYTLTVRNANGTSNASNLRVGGQVASTPITITLANGTSWAVPTNWNPSKNTIEVIGGGGGGGGNATYVPSDYKSPDGGGGGGGGGYSLASNVGLTPGSAVSYSVGSGGGAAVAGGDTYVCNSSSNCSGITGSAVVSGAKGGSGGSSAGGAGGAAASGIGTTKRSGGTGGAPIVGGGGCGGSWVAGGGGGGAAGGSSDGSNGNGYLGGAGGGANAGGGGNGGTCRFGGPGSNYGGGGGGAGTGALLYGEVGGAGAPGYIVITYYPYTQSGSGQAANNQSPNQSRLASALVALESALKIILQLFQ
ncbi:hypothetical protein HY417_01840 [Candidatus Kaiserbacteria bacterium]|nr:hypothetical protein [Candidatus Kaiserbacteria bacterium]